MVTSLSLKGQHLKASPPHLKISTRHISKHLTESLLSMKDSHKNLL